MKTFTLTVAAVAAFGALAIAPAAHATSHSGSAAGHATTNRATTHQATTSHAELSGVVEHDVATPGTHPSFASGECVSEGGHQVCFKRYGDVIWVEGDSSSAMTAYWENHLRDKYGTWHLYRSGYCVNTFSGWGYCNKNFYEDSSTNHYGGTGSGIRLQSCPAACSPEIWIRNNA